MSRYQLTPQADSDLDELWSCVSSNDGAVPANRLEDDLHFAMHRLTDMPGVGHLREDLADESLQFWSLHKLLVFYRPQTSPLQVICVPIARDVAALLASGDCP